MERKQDELVAASKADPDRGFMARLMGTSAAKQMLPLIHLSGGCGSRVSSAPWRMYEAIVL